MSNRRALPVSLALATLAVIFFIAPAYFGASAATGHTLLAVLQSEPVSLDECFDVPLSQRAACHDARVATLIPYRPRHDECFDVPLTGRTSCQNASSARSLSYRSRLDECFDVPLSQRTWCANARIVFRR